jgi:hypothetical protein
MHSGGLRALAAAVLGRTIKDAHGHPPYVPQDVKLDAWKALRHPDDLRLWCDCLDIDLESFRRAVRENGHRWTRSKRLSAATED